MTNKICFNKNGNIKIHNIGISITDSYASREREETSPPGTKPTGGQKMQKEKERLWSYHYEGTSNVISPKKVAKVNLLKNINTK